MLVWLTHSEPHRPSTLVVLRLAIAIVVARFDVEQFQNRGDGGNTAGEKRKLKDAAILKEAHAAVEVPYLRERADVLRRVAFGLYRQATRLEGCKLLVPIMTTDNIDLMHKVSFDHCGSLHHNTKKMTSLRKFMRFFD